MQAGCKVIDRAGRNIPDRDPVRAGDHTGNDLIERSVTAAAADNVIRIAEALHFLIRIQSGLCGPYDHFIIGFDKCIDHIRQLRSERTASGIWIVDKQHLLSLHNDSPICV